MILGESNNLGGIVLGDLFVLTLSMTMFQIADALDFPKARVKNPKMEASSELPC
jgi:hypothetical protein